MLLPSMQIEQPDGLSNDAIDNPACGHGHSMELESVCRRHPSRLLTAQSAWKPDVATTAHQLD